MPDPERWASSEIEENIPQLARALFLRSLWRDYIDTYRSATWIDEALAIDEDSSLFGEARQALERLGASEAARVDIANVARYVAYQVAFGLLYHLDYGADEEMEDGPGWSLAETNGEMLTGRILGGLHEDLLALEPEPTSAGE